MNGQYVARSGCELLFAFFCCCWVSSLFNLELDWISLTGGDGKSTKFTQIFSIGSLIVSEIMSNISNSVSTIFIHTAMIHHCRTITRVDEYSKATASADGDLMEVKGWLRSRYIDASKCRIIDCDVIQSWWHAEWFNCSWHHSISTSTSSDNIYVPQLRQRHVIIFCILIWKRSSWFCIHESKTSPMRWCWLEKWKTLDTDIIVIITNTRSKLTTLPLTFKQRMLGTSTIWLFIKQTGVKVLKLLQPIPEPTSLKTHLTADSFVVWDCPTKKNIENVRIWFKLAKWFDSLSGVTANRSPFIVDSNL